MLPPCSTPGRRLPARCKDVAVFTPSYSLEFQRRSGTPLPLRLLYVMIVSLVCCVDCSICIEVI
jgi:hypothetical protein